MPSSDLIVENAYKYYDRLFPDNPFIKVDKWIEAKPVIKGWSKDQIKKKQEECKSWWRSYKIDLQETVKNKMHVEHDCMEHKRDMMNLLTFWLFSSTGGVH